MMKRCKCGNAYFSAVQECTQNVIVDTFGDAVDECGVNVYESAEGPYTCIVCDAEYADLDDLPQFPDGTFPDNPYEYANNLRLFAVCVSEDNIRDAQVYIGKEDNPDKSWDDENWQSCKYAEIFLGFVSAGSPDEAIRAMSDKEKLPEHVLIAHEAVQ